MEAKKKKLRARICILLAAVILLGACALTLTAVLAVRALGASGGNGLLTRSEIVVETAHFKVNVGMMAYFFTEQIAKYYRRYEPYFNQAADPAQTKALMSQLLGIPEPGVSFKEQNFSGKTESDAPITVFDFYMGLTEENVTGLLTYCEYAYEHDIALTQEDYGAIIQAVEQMEQDYKSEKQAAKQAGEQYFITFSAYLKDTYGTNITKQDVRKCLELIRLAEKAEQTLTEEQKKSMASDPDAVQQYALKHHAEFYMADFYGYGITVSNDGMTDAEFEAAKQKAWLQIADLTVTPAMQYFENELTELLIASDMQSYREKYWDRYLKEAGNDQAKAQEALQAYFDKTYTDEYKRVRFQATLVEQYKRPSDKTVPDSTVTFYPVDGSNPIIYPSGSPGAKNDTKVNELCDWLFGTEQNGYTDHARKGDMKVIESTSTKQASNAHGNYEVETYTVTVYRCAKQPYVQSEITKQFGYALFQNKADAEQFFAKYCKGEMNKDTLYALAEQMRGQMYAYAYDASDAFLLDDFEDRWSVNWVYKSGDFTQKVEVMDVYQWLENAKPGDCTGVLETEMTYKSVDPWSSSLGGTDKRDPVYAILVYDGEGQEYWYAKALNGATKQGKVDWYEQNRLVPVYNRKAYELIDK